MRRGLFDPWEGWRKALGLAGVIFIAGTVVVLSFPVGVGALMLLVFATYVWKPTWDGLDFDRASYQQYTRAFRVASFFETARNSAAEVFSPIVLLGAGPPQEDPDHNLQPSFWPPFRLAAWWSFAGALALSTIEVFANELRMTSFGFTIPWFVVAVLSVPGWFAVFQALAHVRRISPHKDGEIVGQTPAPATMLNKIEDHMELRPSLIRSAMFSAIPVSVILLTWAMAKWVWWITVVLVVVSAVMTTAILWSRNLAAEYRAEWMERAGKLALWEGVWRPLIPSTKQTPAFNGDYDLPFYEEYEEKLRKWEAEQEAEDDEDFDLDRAGSEPPEYEVWVKTATFAFPSGMTYRDVAGFGDQLRTALNAAMVGIMPVGELDAMGRERAGTISAMGFRVFYAPADSHLASLGDRELLNPALDQWALLLLIQTRVIDPLSRIRGVGLTVMVSRYSVTREESPQQIIGLKLRPMDPGVSVENFLDRLEDIRRAARVDWVRVTQGTENGEILMYLGDEPVHDVTLYSRPAHLEHKMVDTMNWLYYFHANKLRGQSGTPRLITREQTTQVVDKLTFSLPPGLAMKQVKAAEEALASSSGNEFLEISLNPPEDEKPNKTTRQSRFVKQTKTITGTQFSVVASRVNPLRRTFNFTDYADQVMTGREPGVAKINWAAGVLSDDTLAYDDWSDNDAPHLLVAGASGSGKAADVDSSILTPGGFKRLGDIEEGDTVFDADGQPARVIHAFEPETPQTAYDVAFSDGSSVRVSGSHVWSVSTREDRLALASVKRANARAEAAGVAASAEVAALESVLNAFMMDDRGDCPEVSEPGKAYTWHGCYREAEAWMVEAAPSTRWHVAPGLHDQGASDKESADWPYLAGLLLGCGMLGGTQATYLSTSDEGFADNAGEHGIKLSLDRVKTGRARYRVLGAVRKSPAWALVGAARSGDQVPPAQARQMLEALSYASGWRDGSNTVIRVASSVLSADSAQVLAESAAGRCRVHAQDGFVFITVPEQLPVSDTNVDRIAAQACSEILYAADGTRAASLADIATLTGLGVDALRNLVKREGIEPIATWRHPIVQTWASGKVIKASRPVALYGASEVARAALNATKARLRDQLPEALTFSEFTTEDMVPRVMGAHGEHEFSVQAKPVHFPPRNEPLPVDPYALGAWLGDGTSRTGELCGVDDDIFDRIDTAYERAWTRFEPERGGGRFRVAKWPQLSDALRACGLLGRGLKRIPEEYQTASFAERLALTQGLLDTDGHISKSGRVEVTLASKPLIDDLTRLIRGLGVVVSEPRRKLTRSAEDSTHEAWRITFTTNLPVFHMGRKACRLPVRVSDRASRRYITAITPVPAGEVPQMRCITVGSPSRTYLISEAMIPTHNSVAMSSMILQIAHNNGPNEAQFWMIEPKNEMQIYRHLDSVTHFVDSWTPSSEFVENAANLVDLAVAEMQRRNEAFVSHPKQPKNLAKAREIAVRESERDDIPLEDHPLYMPYIFLIIEECASLFAGVRPDERDDQLRLMGGATEIARKARSAGIHLVLATQYPTKESLPVTIRNQCRSVGFRCQNEVASRVVIGETGLEDVQIKGAGKLRVGMQYRLFRGFWVQDGDPDHNEQNDIVATLDGLPSNNGQQSALRKAGEVPRISVPAPSESAFQLWNSAAWGGRRAADLVDSKKGGYSAAELLAMSQGEP